MDSAGDRVYAEGRQFDSRNKGTEGYPDGLVGTILWQSGALSTVISTDQGVNPFVSKWFHQVWDGERSVVLSAHMRRADFSGCDIDHVDVRELPEGEQRTAIGAYTMHVNLLEAIRTDGDTICNVRDGVRTVSICNALEAAVRHRQATDGTKVIDLSHPGRPWGTAASRCHDPPSLEGRGQGLGPPAQIGGDDG